MTVSQIIKEINNLPNFLYIYWNLCTTVHIYTYLFFLVWSIGWYAKMFYSLPGTEKGSRY